MIEQAKNGMESFVIDSYEGCGEQTNQKFVFFGCKVKEKYADGMNPKKKTAVTIDLRECCVIFWQENELVKSFALELKLR